MNKTLTENKKEFFANTESFLTKWQAEGIWDGIEKLMEEAKKEGAREIIEEIEKRLDYEKKYRLGSYQNGFSGSESGECCDKCRMEDKHFDGRADFLKAIVGCRNPFQIETTCQCHIPFRKVAVATKIKTLEELLLLSPKPIKDPLLNSEKK
jgi:hypothetical protein